MQRYEITVDGNAIPGIYATQAEADAALRSMPNAKNGQVREKQDAAPAPAAPKAPVPNDGLGTFSDADPSKVLVQKDGVIFEQQGLADGHGLASPGAEQVAAQPATPGNTPQSAAAAAGQSQAPQASSPSNAPPRR
jgi:hypothetical protein